MIYSFKKRFKEKTSKSFQRIGSSIKVDKRDPQDRIYMHITGKNGNTSVFAGTDILS